MKKKNPLRFGILTDVQYADHDDAYSFYGAFRSYRGSVSKLRNAIKFWNKMDLSFIVHLGDVIDCRARKNSEKDMKTILREFSKSKHDVFHVVGNHDCFQMKKEVVKKLMCDNHSNLSHVVSNKEKDGIYYSFDIEDYRLIVLDTYDISYFTENKEKKKIADALLKKYNKNEDLDEPPKDYSLRRYVKWTSGVGTKQLKFLDTSLKNTKKKCIIFSHCSLSSKHVDNACLIWNHEDVMKIVNKYKNIIAVFTGHDHDGGYFFDKNNGIHHFCLNGMIESGKNDCFGTVEISEENIILDGKGKMSSKKVEMFCKK